MLRFLIGPSGVGKTTVIAVLKEKYPSIECVELDRNILERNKSTYGNCGMSSKGDQLYWDVAQEVLQSLELQHKQNPQVSITIVDVGAGALQTSSAFAFFQSRRESIIILFDTPENVFKRLAANRPEGPHKTLEGLRNSEYSNWRMRFYSLGLKCDITGLTKSEACQRFITTWETSVTVLE